MTARILVTNARLVNEGSVSEGDLRVKNGRIEQIASQLSAQENEQVIDADGAWLMPGMIDDQVHFREPGLTHKGDLFTESRAAVAGGITSFMEMPNTNPQTITVDALHEKYALAEGRTFGNHGFYFGATNDNLSEIQKLPVGLACGIKTFMGASTGNMLVDNPETLNSIFRDAPILIATHCEDTPIIQANEAAWRERFGADVPMREHPNIRSAEACLKSSSLAIGLAKKHDARLHVLHLTTAIELDQFTAGIDYRKRITAEACVHHLWFEESQYHALGSSIKCNPAVKKASDRDAIIAAVLDGRIDCIATDHAPHTSEEKAGSYFQCAAGLPLVQHALPSLIEKVLDGVFSIEQIVEKTAHAPAEHYSVGERGYLREGYWADLVLIDPNQPWTVSAENILYKCGWSPFTDTTFRSRVRSTIVNGEITWHEGQLGDGIFGQRLQFGPTR